MASIDDRLKDIYEIRSMMEQSSKFLSLSGLSGIGAGIVGIIAVVIAEFSLGPVGNESPVMNDAPFAIIGSVVTLIVAVSVAAYFSVRMARKKGLPLWGTSTKSLLMNLFIPLASGGLFCLVLLYHHIPFLIAPSMLIFYGLALLNTSKYTFKEIRYLGVSEICLGLIAALWFQFGLILWGAGFGILHIVYGTVMYFKYEK